MERVLLAADYPNLTELKLFNFTQEDDLPNLKCFSLKCYRLIDKYDEKILPLHRMIYHRDTFIDSFHLQNEILLYIPRLHSFTFYISTYEDTADLFRYIPSQDIQQIATNLGRQ
ncbi:unnamed protein product [Rotaria sp. Silwood2]|nr:unnamed protein product [Rotaria sp. Silwood2]CAF2943866.1 unnamed protein product [Rotaria sp. Silwood2]CAF4622713.1 unnamed protein product [Rotaria sp. Silwood2]